GIVDAGGKAFGYGLDIVDLAATAEFVEKRAAEFKNIDILINCVGMQIENPAEEYKEEDWDTLFDVNLKSGFFLSQAVAKVQIRNNAGGKHIHLSSVRSMLGIRRGFIAYCTTKGGMNLMVKQLATEWAKYNITVNAIAPTFIRTEQVAKYLNDPEFYKGLVERIPLGRVGEPEDISGMAMYLAAPAADFITGQTIFADGGVTSSQ
ncbi:MAG: SDR family oxidoreductase, partial [Spirochaetales bacterium]|nr:SDR family oxidoreductase [Spirochaetales bacterium]